MNHPKKKTVVLGATPNPERYAYLATLRLAQQGHPVVPIGIKSGHIGEIEILQGQAPVEDVDTITLYLGAERQRDWQEYILSLKPKRIIFNPGAENDELQLAAREQGIETLEACTLVMLSLGRY